MKLEDVIYSVTSLILIEFGNDISSSQSASKNANSSKAFQ